MMRRAIVVVWLGVMCRSVVRMRAIRGMRREVCGSARMRRAVLCCLMMLCLCVTRMFLWCDMNRAVL
jgi:hypothetical protein